MSRVWGWTAFAKRSGAMKAPVGLLSGSAVCEAKRSNESPSGAFKRQRGLRQQMEGFCPDKRYPNKITWKCRRIAEVKSRWSTTFSRIENLWPRDGSCPLPLRSKPFLGNCFRIVKTQKISRGDSAHVMGSPFDLNEVPAPVCAAALSGSPTESVRLWRSITFRRLMKDSRYSFPEKKNTAHAAQRWILSGESAAK